MNRRELVRAAARNSGMAICHVDAALEALTETIIETLSNGKSVKLVGFGTWELKNRAPRIGRNPTTGERIEIPARVVTSFTPGKELKEAIENVTLCR